MYLRVNVTKVQVAAQGTAIVASPKNEIKETQ